jgi:hypothetical protein
MRARSSGACIAALAFGLVLACGTSHLATVADGGAEDGSRDSGADAGAHEGGPPRDASHDRGDTSFDAPSDAPVPEAGADGLPAAAFGVNYTATSFDGSVPNNPWPPPSVTLGSVRAWDNGTAWKDLEKDAGAFDFSSLDAMHALVAASGVDDFEYTAGMTPAWAAMNPTESGCHLGLAGTCSPPSDVLSTTACSAVPSGGMGDCFWKEFIYKLFQHVTSSGRSYIRKFSPWNEFTTVHEFWTEGEPYPMLAQMAADAYAIIKSIDPSVLVFTPSATSTGGPMKMCEYLDGGSTPGKFADALDFHTYIDTTHVFPPENVLGYLESYRACMTSANFMAGKDIYSDEGGWGQNLQTNLPNSPNASCAGDAGCMVAASDTATAFIARYYLLQLFWGVKGFWWYATGADEWGSLGTLSKDGKTFTALPDATAYTEVYDWLVGATLGPPCTNGDAGTVWTCDLTRASPKGFSARAVWDTGGSSSYTNPKPGTWSHWKDLTGTTRSIAGAVPIGPMPVLIEP